MEIVLASSSPRRRALLKKLGLKFKVIPSQVKEILPKNLPPGEAAKRLALKKAEAVAKTLKEGLVIAADTIVVLRGEVLGKPKDYKGAKEMLQKLSGTRHRVITGIAVMDARSKKKLVDAECTWVKMKKMNQRQIIYFAKKHLDKAGAYAVQEEGDLFIESIEGSFSNVVGLPMEKLTFALEKMGTSSAGP